MEVWYGAEQVPATLSAPGDAGTVVTIGIFDGVHRGHQAILTRVVERARQMARPDGRRPLAVAITFDPHPVLVHRPEARLPMIASLADRLAALSATGLDAVLVVHYTLEFADQSPEEFVRTWLEGLLGARMVVVGDDVRFGRGNSGDAALLEAICRADGLGVEILDDVRSPSGRRWSSTWVRELLEAGDMGGAAEVLGRASERPREGGPVVHARDVPPRRDAVGGEALLQCFELGRVAGDENDGEALAAELAGHGSPESGASVDYGDSHVSHRRVAGPPRGGPDSTRRRARG